MISFSNTEIAFKDKSKKDLNRAYWLFTLIGSPFLVKMGKPLTMFALRIGLPIKGLIKSTIFKQFCGGEDIESCRPRMESLAMSKIGTILDYSVEGKTEEDDFEQTVAEIMATIDAGANNPNIPFAVFKVTGICQFDILEKFNDPNAQLTVQEKAAIQIVEERVDRICRHAYEKGTPVFIDAEESWIQDGIDRLAYEMMERYNKESTSVFNTVQIYRHDRLEHLKEQTKVAQEKGYQLGVKLVRGAYMEKERKRAEDMNYPSPIQKDKASTDLDFNKALEWMVEHISNITFCAGTHNEESTLLLTQLLDINNIPHDSENVYFAQLLGMSDHLSYNLAHHEFNVAKYVPYGPIEEVMPYLLRRADENTSVAGQTSRELTLISLERNRRKNAQ